MRPTCVETTKQEGLSRNMRSKKADVQIFVAENTPTGKPEMQQRSRNYVFLIALWFFVGTLSLFDGDRMLNGCFLCAFLSRFHRICRNSRVCEGVIHVGG